MKVMIESKELGVLLCSRIDFEQKKEYVVMYGFGSYKTDSFALAMNNFSNYCEHSANCEG